MGTSWQTLAFDVNPISTEMGSPPWVLLAWEVSSQDSPCLLSSISIPMKLKTNSYQGKCPVCPAQPVVGVLQPGLCPH